MEHALVGLESRPTDGEAVRCAFRVLHTLKGSAASLGFPELADYAHEVESILAGMRDGSLLVSRETITPMLRVVDVLRRLVPEAASGSTLDMREAHAVLGPLAAHRGADAPAAAPGGGTEAAPGGEDQG